ncbi:MAG: hypothetical protein ACREUT_16590 [Steroidobacteraceae bacterium]
MAERAVGTERRARMMLPLAAAVAAICAAGCSHLPPLHRPWSHRPAPQPQAVHELVMTAGTGATASFAQYWNRNTLVVDLQGVSGTGRVVLTTPAGATWPFRLAFRVMPGSVGELDVQADQRWVVPVVPRGAKPVDLVLPTGLYSRATPRIEVAWEPAPQ